MEPKYATLADFIDAVRSGEEPTDGITVWIDNDAVVARRPGGEDDDGYDASETLWDEDLGPGETCIALFEALGIHAEPV